MATAAAQAMSPNPTEKPLAANLSASGEARWLPFLGLPCQLEVDLPLPNFKVGDLIQLRSGLLIATEWRLTRDVPLRVNGTLIGWGEFDGSGNRLAVRLTELA